MERKCVAVITHTSWHRTTKLAKLFYIFLLFHGYYLVWTQAVLIFYETLEMPMSFFICLWLSPIILYTGNFLECSLSYLLGLKSNCFCRAYLKCLHIYADQSYMAFFLWSTLTLWYCYEVFIVFLYFFLSFMYYMRSCIKNALNKYF